MEKVSLLIKVSFILITILTIYQFYRAGKKSTTLLALMSGWAIIQFILAYVGFYHDTSTSPPRFLFLILPVIIFIIAIFFSKRGRNFIDGFDLGSLILLHTIRIFVELVLYALLIAGTIPKIMTFEGQNLDIVAGLTAPLVYYFTFVKHQLSNRLLIYWNLVSLGLLINIVVIAILSTRIPFQKFGFEQSNIAIEYFPFNWLPAVVVPIVFFAHLVALRQLIVKK